MPPVSVVGSGVRLDRVVAVLATLRDGREQIGSGYLVNGRLVVTAAHCARDKATGEAANRLRVIRASDGTTAAVDLRGVVADYGLEVAVLPLVGMPWKAEQPVLTFARVDRSQSGVLEDCAGIGFPLFQRDPKGNRDTSEFHGVIYQTDEVQSGRLLMREPLIRPSPIQFSCDARSVDNIDRAPSPWGGLSGAVAFYRGDAIGVVVEHHPRQGDSAIRMIGFDRVAADNPKVGQILGIPDARGLSLVRAEPVVPLAELVEFWAGDDLPAVADLDPYRLGATASEYGDRTSYGERDPYVPRTSHDVDSRIREALQPSRLVMLVGRQRQARPEPRSKPSRTGGRRHDCWHRTQPPCWPWPIIPGPR
jgi:Trypsin-like peptidase domain